jgi:cyclic beta-1,2-glucan synthetase
MAFWPRLSERRDSPPWDSENAIREEVFGRERIEQHAESLARAQRLTDSPVRVLSLHTRLANNEQELLAAHRTMAKALAEGHSVTPGAEWLINNSHVVEEQIRDVRKNLPPAYYEQLPRLADGPLAGYPRVLGVAWAFVAHTDSRFDRDLLRDFVNAYQRIDALKIGELWALPLTLRLVLVENLRRAACRIVTSREQRKQADDLADRIAHNSQITHAELAADSIVDPRGELKAAFVVQLIHRLGEGPGEVGHARQWLLDQLGRLDLSADEVVRQEHHSIAATNNSVRHIIRSMRVMPDVDWADFFESVSLVNIALNASPTFAKMDFATRNSYRDVIEQLARRAPLPEFEIAECAVAMAARSPLQSKAREPGYYLLGKGRRSLEAKIGFRRRLRDIPAAVTQKGGLLGYLTSVVLLAVVVLTLPCLALVGQNISSGILAILVLAGILPAIDLAMAIVNQAISHEIKPQIIPGLELPGGIPDDASTLVAIPALLSDGDGVDELINRLEIHHLATQQENVFYALLTDWTDSLEETVTPDNELLTRARAGIERLNRLHPSRLADHDSFYIFHRRRQWSAGESKWMGWERKRGKLHELNRLLRGVGGTSFISGEAQTVACPPTIKYVITLDADTRLPRDTVRRLVGKMLHPLNRPVFLESEQRIADGYALLQPRVTPILPTEQDASLYQRLFSSTGGIDPYAGAVSDVYQDLFGEGSFAGKGIYDIDAFEKSASGRFPENAILSHDLIEGIYAGAGLATDIEVVEEFPSRYDVARARDHRWVRGDWQLLPWILTGRAVFGTARKHGGRDRLTALGRWKMVDNLRRSLTPVAIVIALVTGWLQPFQAAAIWTGFIAISIGVPTFLSIVANLTANSNNTTEKSHFAALAGDAKLAIAQSTLHLTLVADKAYAMTDAIVRTFYRVFFSRRNLLEWTTAAQAKSMAAATTAAYYKRMSGGVALGFLAFTLVALSGSDGLKIALPVTVLWLAAPAIAQWVSFRPAGVQREALSTDNSVKLRIIGRRTWLFFEEFVGAEDHFLPPDNFQEEPRPVVAHRTSPTNIGLYLLSTVSAHDFGWISVLESAERLEQTLRSVGDLARLKGHLYNWYDTRTMTVLEPRYVSAVDSGNLAGHLIAVASACREWAMTTGPNLAASDGIADCIAILKTAAPTATQSAAVTGALQSLLALFNASRSEEAGATLLKIDWDAVRRSAVALAELLERDQASPAGVTWARAAARTADSHMRHGQLDQDDLRILRRRLTAIADAADYMALSMDFSFLIDTERELLSIGYSVDDGKIDESCYDLLASEARLASFVAIAKGDVATRHWFRLGRTLLPVSGTSVLISWSGSMFEYLMPDLVTLTPPDSLLGKTARAAVNEQMRFGIKNATPWGVSESAYNARDLDFTYQYSSFGVPELGLKRGLGEHLVVAPYATGLASMVAPNAAALNYESLAAIGGCGDYGFYEAIDFTPTRVARSQRFEVIKAYMAHHQGMTIVALANAILGNAIARRFHAAPIVQAAELLLQERAPRLVPKPVQRATLTRVRPDDDELSLAAVRRVKARRGFTPECQFLANGHLSVLVTASGAGYTRWNGLAVTRWNGDATLDNLGSFIYLRDTQSGAIWSVGHQPIGSAVDSCEASFTEDRVQLSRREGSLRTVLDVIVSPEDDATCRRLSISNLGKKHRTIDVTSYEELVLGSADADTAHPAFSKLFVETEFDGQTGAIVANRRKRGPDDCDIYVAAFVDSDASNGGAFEYETDRAKFIGRGRTLASPISVINGRPLSGSVGAVIDPVFALRQQVIIPPGATVRLSFWTAVAESREALLPMIEKYKDAAAFTRSAMLAWTHGLVELRHLSIDADDAMVFQQLAGALVYSSPALRASELVLQSGALGFGALWPAGISGDLPIVLVRIDEVDDIGLVRQLLHAFEYWRHKGVEADLVILNSHAASYQQELQTALETLYQSVPSRHRLGRDNSKGSVYLLRSDLLQPRTLAALPAAARAVFHARRGALAEQIVRLTSRAPVITAPPRRSAPPELSMRRADMSDLEFYNGFGGFRQHGREYVTILDSGQTTPAPWINVIANPSFGFHVAADGGGYTWCTNSRERQVTPWSNDPVSNRPGEVFYVRDEDTGELWSPTATPIRDHASPYIVAHGQGYSRFEHTSRGIELVLEQFVDREDPVKISRLTLRNVSGKLRRLSVTSYVEWVLGSSRRATASHITTEYDSSHSAIYARNPWHHFFPDRVAFSSLSGDIVGWTADRGDFIGLDGTLDNPAALASKRKFPGTAGTGHDSCAALQTVVSLSPLGQAEIVGLLGDAPDKDEAQRLVAKYSGVDAGAALRAVVQDWDRVLDKVQVKTPDRALDLLMNRWLPYQTLSCRLWGRAGLYQAGGAFGFRDQLQDVMSLAMTRPDITRAHILTAAGRQFVEGDVQHWWLSPSGHGVRTRIADSCLWLAYVTAHYVKTTSDAALLDEIVPFIDGPRLKAHEHEVYFLPELSGESGSLFEHCARALDRSLAVGAHGLALFGGGDWNDGMNRVGIDGRGESIWLSWFLMTCLNDMLPYADMRGEKQRAEVWRKHIATLRAGIDDHGWDGQWYRRGYFDDGTPLGSSSSDECQIDCIAQSWSVISGAEDIQRSRQAMTSVQDRLIDREAKLALLFTPPFDKTKLDPGYIKGYPPGIRENGGQYTHAAAWSVIALADLGDGDGAGELLSLINPINLSASQTDSRRYKLEPYVVAADVYSVGKNQGRGGWSWYTGAAGWIYRAALEHVLGVKKEGETLVISPSIPSRWPGFEVTYIHEATTYRIVVTNPSSISRGLIAATLNGSTLDISDGCKVTVPLTAADTVQVIAVIMGLEAAGTSNLNNVKTVSSGA